MSNQTARFIGDIPDHYDCWLGPHYFVDYAEDLTKRVAATNPTKVLEIAAGTGIVTRMLRDVLPQTTELIATDLNAPMLEVAKRKFKSDEVVEFFPVDATQLDFSDAMFDAIVCQFGVMFFPDKDKSYREAYRVLQPGGYYIFNVWDSWEFNPSGRIAHDTIATFFPDDPPTFYKIPFGYHAIDPIKASLLAAGFNQISAQVISLNKVVPKMAIFAKGIVFGNPVIGQIRERGTINPDEVVAAVCLALHRAFGDDPSSVPLQAIMLSARKPARPVRGN
jgi:ubiquinone/menaquinone biosynthesis C-methylase UbiE